MESNRFSTSIDYNRTLVWPVRILHHSVAWAADHPVCSLLAAGLILTLALMPADLLITLAAKDLFASFPSDVRREVLALQQYGQMTFSLVIGIVILLLAPRQRARIWGWVVSSLLVFLSANALKIRLEVVAQITYKVKATDESDIVADFELPGYLTTPGK